MQPSDHEFITPLFLGASAENDALLERLLLAAVRDHVYWRRNFHPEDPPPISTSDALSPGYTAGVARTEQALRELAAALKRSTPMHSPRYVGHMASDLLLPGLVAQMMTMLYNPNNVSAEVAPVTVALEHEVGRQLARMIGYRVDPAAPPCAYGHLTSGGTLANYEALWLARSLRFFPTALAAVDPATARRDPWSLLNLDVAETVRLRDHWLAALAGRPDREARVAALAAARFEHQGLARFQAERRIAPPVVIAPCTAHYSWPKAMQALGFGDAQLWPAAVDRHMRIDPRSVRTLLARARRERVPVLAVIGVLGTTEFGTIDPIHQLVALREEARAQGQWFWLHVDAAWGGYLSTLFREPEGGLTPRATLRRRYRHFPSEPVYAAFAALASADSVTIDPHKLGFLPFGAGALVARDRRITDFVSNRPVYLYDPAEAPDEAERQRHLGTYILEGSKPGAAAAAAFVSHRQLPLDRRHFGRLTALTLDASEYLYDRIHAIGKRMDRRCRIRMPIEPDTNLICVSLNPAGNRQLAVANAFTRRVYARMSAAPDEPVQTREFLGSHTALLRRNLDTAAALELMRALGLDPATFCASPAGDPRAADHVFLLRHTLMNPWLTHVTEGRNYLDRYLDFLERAIAAELAVAPAAPPRIPRRRPRVIRSAG